MCHTADVLAWKVLCVMYRRYTVMGIFYCKFLCRYITLCCTYCIMCCIIQCSLHSFHQGQLSASLSAVPYNLWLWLSAVRDTPAQLDSALSPTVFSFDSELFRTALSPGKYKYCISVNRKSLKNLFDFWIRNLFIRTP